ncbi:hypothetical protein VPG91_12970 [Nitrospirillum amazonense]|uniref:hypothetical protein n=1 Tax=Nitrospirillum amazonense TaxID=28077 RepID=UPI002DD44BB9|nr:hypothetical protein [Nitrospirillum amazonense]MEC4591902.1 hypothetical protein [Nitrospirillum amazonense]
MAKHRLDLRITFDGPADSDVAQKSMERLRGVLPAGTVIEVQGHVMAVSVDEMPTEQLRLIESARMDPRHDHLNQLLDE